MGKTSTGGGPKGTKGMGVFRTVTFDLGKLIQVFLLLAGTTLLAILDVIDSTVVATVYGAAAGYVFGNGKSAANGHGPAMIIAPRHQNGDEGWDAPVK